MRRTILLVAAVALFSLPAGGALADSDNPFQGRWVGTDEVDRSKNTLSVGGGRNFARYQEDRLSACASLTGSPSRGFASGFATIDGEELSFEATLYCVVPGVGLVPSEAVPDPFLFRFFDNEDGTISFEGDCFRHPSEPECAP